MKRSQVLALVGLVLFSATALAAPVDADDSAVGPLVVPMRGRADRALRQAVAVPSYSADDLPGDGVDTGVPAYGDDGGYGYGYYAPVYPGVYFPGGGPAPGIPGSEPTMTPGTDADDMIRSSFTATFATANAGAILNNPLTLSAFKKDIMDAIAQGLDIPLSRVEWGRAYAPGASRRSLLQDTLAIDYFILYPQGTSLAKIAEDRKRIADNPNLIFPPNLLAAYSLSSATVTPGVITNVASQPPSPPGNRQAGTDAPRALASAASRTGVSLALSGLAMLGASLLMGML